MLRGIEDECINRHLRGETMRDLIRKTSQFLWIVGISMAIFTSCAPTTTKKTQVQVPHATPAVKLENTPSRRSTVPDVSRKPAIQQAVKPEPDISTKPPMPVYVHTSRIALIIGNAAYPKAPLDNPVNDAYDMANVLKNLGFQAIVKTNADKKTMKTAVREFGQKLTKGSVGVFYYSGHGLQSKGLNYLIPIHADIQDEADIEFETMEAYYVLRQMEQANNGVNLVILDACRDNPYKSYMKGSQNGLARMDSPTGSLIAYATSPGTVAYGTGKQRNSIYTKHLLTVLQSMPTLSVTDLFIQVRNRVMQETNGQQVPWESVSLTRPFRFVE